MLPQGTKGQTRNFVRRGTPAPDAMTEGSMVHSLKLPGRTLFGKGALEEAGAYIRALGTRALIVTGKVVQRARPSQA